MVFRDAKKKKKGKKSVGRKNHSERTFFRGEDERGKHVEYIFIDQNLQLIYEDYQSYIQNRSPSIIYFRRLITLSLSINQSLDLSFRVPAFILLRRFAII